MRRLPRASAPTSSSSIPYRRCGATWPKPRPGTVTQVRVGVQAMIRSPSRPGAAMVLVGHVTKDGQIAGPRVVEHMVDAVLYFEGDRGHHHRIMRTVKNRFGPTDEIGVFEMSDKGLREVTNPSALFLGERNSKSPGAAVFAGVEGTRPVLVEVQALVAPTSLGTPRRAVVGWDSSRLAMILAVLGGPLRRPAGQATTSISTLRAATESPNPRPTSRLLLRSFLRSPLLLFRMIALYFGEISLSGAVRPVGHTGLRLKEAEKLGFQTAVLPTGSAETAEEAFGPLDADREPDRPGRTDRRLETCGPCGKRHGLGFRVCGAGCYMGARGKGLLTVGSSRRSVER